MRKFKDSQNVFITSDQHFGHYNIISFAKRPCKNVAEMNETLIKNHNSVVTNDDVTIHLGDFIWSGSKFDDIVFQLNGFHIFLRGNHDGSYPTHSHAFEHSFKYEILHNQIFEFIYKNFKYVASHYPIYEWNGYYQDVLHFYGHTHKELDYDENAFHVGVDGNNLTPINLNSFLKK